MKPFLLKIAVLFLFTLAFPTKASLLTINGFTLNTDTQIVSGNSLEWLRWPETANMSIQQALNIYQPEGWRLAYNQEVVDLMNVFFAAEDWSPALDENTSVGATLDHTAGGVNLWRDFTNIMGVVFSPGPAFSNMLFGEDADSDGFYRSLGSFYSDYDPVVVIGDDHPTFTNDFSDMEFGVLLVREPANTVPISSTVTLLLLPIAVLLLRNRKTDFLL
ncbi:hypothetical protein [Glaciecola sp. 1036]|uniref:hypothetical protein n=1 Tax=Alteromonadaceae TaxID=72275 RepID=UPI003D08C2D8